jgi:hypothetical protein
MKKILVGLIIIVSVILTIICSNFYIFIGGLVAAVAVYLEPFAHCSIPYNYYQSDKYYEETEPEN